MIKYISKAIRESNSFFEFKSPKQDICEKWVIFSFYLKNFLINIFTG